MASHRAVDKTLANVHPNAARPPASVFLATFMTWRSPRAQLPGTCAGAAHRTSISQSPSAIARYAGTHCCAGNPEAIARRTCSAASVSMPTQPARLFGRVVQSYSKPAWHIKFAYSGPCACLTTK